MGTNPQMEFDLSDWLQYQNYLIKTLILWELNQDQRELRNQRGNPIGVNTTIRRRQAIHLR